MRPVTTPSCTVVLRSPMDGIEDLPCERILSNVVMSTWEPTDEERVAIAEGAFVELYVMSLTPHPPVAVEVSKQLRELPAQTWGGRDRAEFKHFPAESEEASQ